MGRERQWRWTALFVLALLVTGLEAVGALLVYSLLGLVADPEVAPELPAIGPVDALFPGVAHGDLVVGFAVGLALFFVVRGAALIAAAYVRSRIVENAGAQLASELVRGYLALPYAYLTQRNSSELIRNTFQSVQSVMGQVLRPLVAIGSEGVLIVGLLALLAALAPQATILAVVILGGSAWLLLRAVQPRLKRLGRRRQEANRESLQAVQQALSGIREIRLHGRERQFAQTFRRARVNQARAQYLHGAVQQLPKAVIETALVFVIAVVFIVAIYAGQGGSEILATLGLFAYAGWRLEASVAKVVTNLNNLRYGGAALEDLVEDVDRVRPLLAAAAAPREREVPPLRRQIDVDGVTFAYENSDVPALRGVDLTIHRGESLGICGPTGGGKSTLVDVIVGLLEPSEGRVLVDGVDVREDPAGWYRQIGMVSQSVFLTDDTLRRNIAFGLPERQIDEQRLEAAVERAQLVETVEGLPEGLETVVGERGVRLSGGQRQRVAIARALYDEPQVLVFDEGTSALDTATEAALVAALDELGTDRTFIAVAHRLATVRNADRIIVVSEGRITAEGTYDELLERSALFRSLAR